MARLRGCSGVLILLGLIGIITPLFGYQNKLIESASIDLAISTGFISVILIVAGLVIGVFAFRDSSTVSHTRKLPRYWEKLQVNELPNPKLERNHILAAGSVSNMTQHPKNEIPSRIRVCPYCHKEVDKSVSICPYYLRDLPDIAEDYGFDFPKRHAELNAIINRWMSQPLYLSTNKQLSALVEPMKNYAFELIDEGHVPGSETIKRNLDLGELCAHSMAEFAISGLCLGLEHGDLHKQSTPITSIESIPQEVKEMFIVAFQVMNNLFLKLIADVYVAKKINRSYVVNRQDRFNVVAFGVLISCYRLGVATATENIH
jgi:hypothetical protein